MKICPQCAAPSEGDHKNCSACGASLEVSANASTEDPLIGRVIGGGYALQEVVGVGGMGRVYRAEQSALGRTVAVKVIHPHLLGDEETVARFYQEARAASSLNHPNSVSVIDFGRTEDGIIYLVMEYLSGKDLAQVMYEDLPLPFDRTCRILMSILDALSEAHALSVVHRDLKPENIFLRPMRSGTDLIKVVDFGLATIVGNETSITRPGIVCGTPDYMSPEQGRGDAVDARGDVYSVGVLLFELITGRLPFEADTPTKLVMKHIHDPVPDPRDYSDKREIPAALAAITLKALSKQPDERYQSAQEMREALALVAEKLNALSVRRSCDVCGAVCPKNSKFCGECGAKFAAEKAEGRTSARPSFYPPLGSQRTFVGRRQQLERADEFREQAAHGALWVQIDGEIGSGRTRLLAEIAERFATRGDVVAGTGAHPSGALLPYLPVRTVLEELIGSSLDAWLDSNPRDELPVIVKAGLDELLEARGLKGSDGQARVGAVAQALAYFVKRAQKKHRAKCLTLIFDDLDHCDGLTRQSVIEASRVLESTPCLIFTASLSCLEGARSERLSLGAFDWDETQQFLAATGQLGLLDRLLEKRELYAEGLTPLFIEQLEAIATRDETLPQGLADAIGQRLERLSNDARLGLQAIAVAGIQADLAMIRELAGKEGADGLDELVIRTLVQIEGEQVSIVHPFIAEIVEASIPAQARRELHAKLMHYLARHNAAQEILAEHAFRTATPIDNLMSLENIGNQAFARGDQVAAVLAFRRALELARREYLEKGDTALDTAIVTFSRKLGDALSRAGDAAGADGVLREAMELSPAGSETQARMLVALGRVALQRDRRRDAMNYLGRALELVAEVKPEIEVDVQIEIGRIRRAEGAYPQAANAYRRAIAVLEADETQLTRTVRTRIELAEALIAAELITEAAEQLVQAELEAREEEALFLVARAKGILGMLDERQGRQDSAIRRYQEAAELAARAGDAPGQRRWRAARHTLVA